MASIQTSSVTSTSFRARLTGLDTSYSGTDRVAWWELYDMSTSQQVANPSMNLAAGISNSSYQSFTGLTGNTEYRLYCYIYYTGGSTRLGPTYVTTSMPSPDVALSLTVMSATSIKATFTYDSNYPYYRVQWKEYDASSWSGNSVSYTKYSATKSYTITGLQPDTMYSVRIMLSTNSSGSTTGYSSLKVATTDSLPSPSTTLTLTTLSYSSIRASFTYDSNYPYYKVYWKKSSASSWSSNSSSFTSYSATKNYSITGLSPNTTYDVRVLVSNDSSGTYSEYTSTKSTTTSAYPATNATLTLTPLSSESIQATFTYDSDYPYWRIMWKRLEASTWNGTNSASFTQYSSTETYIITGLTPGTTYNARVLVSNDSSGTYTDYTSIQSATTLSYPTVYISDVTVLSYNAISTTFTYDSNYPYYRVRWKPASSSSWTYNSSSYSSYSSSTTYTITGLSANTAYDIEILVATDSSGSNSTTISMDSSVTTLPQPAANINITTIGETSVSGTITIDPNYSYIQTKYKKVSDSTYTYYPSTLTQRTESSWAFTITGLQEDTDYSLNGLVSATGDTSYSYNILSSDISFHTLAPVTIDPWNWTSANSSNNPSHTAEATASQTTAARDACQNKTAISNFKYQVWNDLVYKVSEARVVGGYSFWDTNYATMANTLMTSSDKVLTAVRYNSLLYNISSIYSVPSANIIPTVSTGDPVNGTTHFLNFVTFYLNAYINTL